MIFIITFILALTSSTHDIITTAIENYKNIKSYKVTLKSENSNSSMEVKYYYKKPGFIRMEFIKPYKGAVLVYNPTTKKVRVRPIHFLKPLVLTLSPENRLIRSPAGHRIDESDIGILLRMVQKLQSYGKTERLGQETIGNKQAIHMSIKGEGGATINGIHKYLLWLDEMTLLPLMVSSYNSKGILIEKLLMNDLQINLTFPEDFFSL